MASFLGREVQLRLGPVPVVGSIQPLPSVAGRQELGRTYNRTEVEITSADDDGWRTLAVKPGVRGIDGTLSGIAKSEFLDTLIGLQNSEDPVVLVHVHPNGLQEGGHVFVNNVEVTASHSGAVQFSASVVSTGATRSINGDLVFGHAAHAGSWNAGTQSINRRDVFVGGDENIGPVRIAGTPTVVNGAAEYNGEFLVSSGDHLYSLTRASDGYDATMWSSGASPWGFSQGATLRSFTTHPTQDNTLIGSAWNATGGAAQLRSFTISTGAHRYIGGSITGRIHQLASHGDHVYVIHDTNPPSSSPSGLLLRLRVQTSGTLAVDGQPDPGVYAGLASNGSHLFGLHTGNTLRRFRDPTSNSGGFDIVSAVNPSISYVDGSLWSLFR